jgi:hypothetical protein
VPQFESFVDYCTHQLYGEYVFEKENLSFVAFVEVGRWVMERSVSSRSFSYPLYCGSLLDSNALLPLSFGTCEDESMAFPIRVGDLTSCDALDFIKQTHRGSLRRS